MTDRLPVECGKGRAMKLNIEEARGVVEAITMRRNAERGAYFVGGSGSDGYRREGQALRLLAVAIEEIEDLRTKVRAVDPGKQISRDDLVVTVIGGGSGGSGSVSVGGSGGPFNHPLIIKRL